MEKINTYAVVKKLIGNINPAGDSSIDPQRLENLKEMIRLAKCLIGDIGDMVIMNRHDKSASVVAAVNEANKFLDWAKDQ